MAATKNVMKLLSALDALLGKATVAALCAAKALRTEEATKSPNEEKTNRYVLVAPRDVSESIKKKGEGAISPFDCTFPLLDGDRAAPRENAAAHLLSEREVEPISSVDLFVVFHPGRDRVIPPPWKNGSQFHLSSALERDDRVWVIRPQSFFLQLLEDEYLLFPREDENAPWQSAADFWWKLRGAYRQNSGIVLSGIPFRRGITSSGWAELASHLVQTLFDPRPLELPTDEHAFECSFVELMDSTHFFSLQEALKPLESFGIKVPTFPDEQLNCKHSFKVKASIVQFDLTRPNLLLANLAEDFSEQRGSAEPPATDGADDKVAPRLKLLFPGSSTNMLSRSHSKWLRAHNPSFALVRWDPFEHGSLKSPPIFATRDERILGADTPEDDVSDQPTILSTPVQERRMGWYVNQLERPKESGLPALKGFTDYYQSSRSSYWNVGVNYEADDSSQQRRLLRPWVMTTDYDPFRRALKAVSAFLSINEKVLSEEGFDKGLDSAINLARDTPTVQPNTSSYYCHYLLWYYEYFLQFPVAHDDLQGAMNGALDSFIPALAFYERHFHAFKAPVTSDVTTEGHTPKFVTLSVGLDGERPLSSGDVRMMHRIVDKLAELRAYDKAVIRERKLKHEAQVARTGRMEDLARTLTHDFQKTAEAFVADVDDLFTIAENVPDPNLNLLSGLKILGIEAHIQADRLRLVDLAAHGALEPDSPEYLNKGFRRAWKERDIHRAELICVIAAAYATHNLVRHKRVGERMPREYMTNRDHSRELLETDHLLETNLRQHWFCRDTFLIMPPEDKRGWKIGYPNASRSESLWLLVFFEIFDNLGETDRLRIGGEWDAEVGQVLLTFNTSTKRFFEPIPLTMAGYESGTRCSGGVTESTRSRFSSQGMR